MPRVVTLLERMAEGDSRVEYKKLAGQFAKAFGVRDVWEAKASHKDRVFLESLSRPLRLIGFSHRGDSRLFRHER